jgi:hypothetical protein
LPEIRLSPGAAAIVIDVRVIGAFQHVSIVAVIERVTFNDRIVDSHGDVVCSVSMQTMVSFRPYKRGHDLLVAGVPVKHFRLDA